MSRHDTIRYRDKFCAACEVKFTPRTGRQNYCSKACRLGRATCHTCGKRFVKTKKTTGFYCSSECWYKAPGKRSIPPRDCKSCGKNFQPKGAEIRHCSRACAHATYAKTCGSHPEGSRRVTSQGYVLIKVAGKWLAEHRYAMEQKLERTLHKHERVHHLNGNRQDNRPENLELWKRQHPQGVRAADYHCPGCRCGVQHDTRVIPH